MEELTSEEDYMKMGGDRVSVLFQNWVGCKVFHLKMSFAHHYLDVGASALHSWVQISWDFCTRFAYFLYSAECSWIITSVSLSV